MTELTAVRIAFYKMAELPNEQRRKELEDAKQEAVKTEGEEAVEEAVKMAKRVIDNKQLKIKKGGHLPYSRP